MGKGKQKNPRTSGESCEGKSLLQHMWEELDAITARLMAGQGGKRDKGRAEGVAWCIALVQSPYNPSIDAVREQAMERYEAAEEGEEIPAEYV